MRATSDAATVYACPSPPSLPITSKSRFPTEISFDDFSADELARILVAKVGAMPLSGPPPGVRLTIDIKTALALGRRLHRGAGSRGFGNARDLENRLPGIIQRWKADLLLHEPGWKATAANHTLSVVHLLGERPNAERGVVGEIMRELHGYTGLAEVKAVFRRLVDTMAVAYDEDFLGLPQTNAGLLNRVFQGPPGERPLVHT